MPKEITNDELAAMIKRGFDDAASKSDIKRLDERIAILETKTEDGFRHVNARLSTIEGDISDIRKHFVYRDEFEDLMARVKYLETKLSIESGK
ncbi:hypothetical protein A2662_04710 [Candidatus Giovannonibacteria bacterium RIFCSPHIGHO2_01_FULL_45_33]|uniref:Uncharacterized protein n=1 Tax=Candidatus Giovannonibacteria bacterium RIFCSPLOWO2_01_FULL_45_34 TaxID=1798351 RepID=A0A1F5X1Z6_9BACT|nr:MAG: hypothetical protein A2662_04710 [Candidatus Giovannonibacteria bacterium RIFCSPHIGHO2_01_FULL_45_33]OGF69119.1 MAG: hypothetical protein A3C73_01350 [Candidatus Giovannonibacteria bacterium RIFCSPHIGHO2_02_FULL_44_11]OGF81928.1 MAG: hypothetical protein A2930_01645 [Candidatus Giovannonibacteria bacterium RIFCSPLOWO2_01_FULL_45_34]